jgi:L-amino acid N-acyltransferase YncA
LSRYAPSKSPKFPDPANLKPGPIIRDASARDLATLREIYAYQVRHGNGSFEEKPPDAVEFLRRYEAVRAKTLSYLVAEIEGIVGGYAYVAPFRGRAAYRHTVENSVYVDPETEGRGLGTALLDRLIEFCTGAGIRQMVAVIGDTANTASIKLHERAGFRHAGTLQSMGFKHVQWVNTVTMQRSLGEGDKIAP